MERAPQEVELNGVVLHDKLETIAEQTAERDRRVEIYAAYVERHAGHLDMQAALAEAYGRKDAA